MGDKYQQNWIYYLPWVLLGIRSAYNQNLGTSSLELTIGKHAQLPGTLLADPEDIKLSDDHVTNMLRKLQIKNHRAAIPTVINKPNPPVPTLPENVTHVYVRQHDTKGLSSRFLGPFPVTARPSRSTIEIKVGVTKQGVDRLEKRHISDTKIAYLRDNAKIATRPRRGRPPKNVTNTSNSDPTTSDAKTKQSGTTSDDDLSQPFHGFATQNVATVNFTTPPPPFKRENSNHVRQHAEPRSWTATAAELHQINKSISSRKQV